jgi:AbrB family looped-hinge helix DNA binding protein
MLAYDVMEKRTTNTVTISPKYQVVIPKAIREQMNLQPGQKIRVLAYGDHLSFVPARPIKSMRGFLKGMDAAFERENDRL